MELRFNHRKQSKTEKELTQYYLFICFYFDAERLYHGIHEQSYLRALKNPFIATLIFIRVSVSFHYLVWIC